MTRAPNPSLHCVSGCLFVILSACTPSLNQSAKSITTLSVANSKFQITGSGLGKVTEAKMQGNGGTVPLGVESQSTGSLTLAPLSQAGFTLGLPYLLTLSDARADSFPVTFQLPSGSVTPAMLDRSYLPVTGDPASIGSSFTVNAGNVGMGAQLTARLSVGQTENVTSMLGNTWGGIAVISQASFTSSPAYQALATLDFGTPAYNGPLGRIAVGGDAVGGSKMFFGTSSLYSSGINNTALTIDQFGKIGVGTTSPGATLHVLQASDATSPTSTQPAGILIQTNSTAVDGTKYATLDFGNSRGNGLVAARISATAGSTGSTLTFGTTSNYSSGITNSAMTINNNGLVGIRTGNSALVGLLTVGVLGDGSQISANAYGTLSDLRLKKDLVRIPDPLEKLKQLHGYYFRWRSNPTAPREAGVIAQEVESVLPEIVKTSPDDIKTVDYGKLSSLLIEAVNAQETRLQKLESENQAMKALLCEDHPNASLCRPSPDEPDLKR